MALHQTVQHGVWLNEKAGIDWRTDQFALALVLCRCLLGTHPFTPPGGSAHDAITNVMERNGMESSMPQRLGAAGILNQRIPKPNILVNAFDIGVDPFDGLSDVIQIVR